MSRYEARITENAETGFFALVVRVDRDGEQQVVGRGKHYATRANAELATARQIAKFTGVAA